jgi:hypothetical protein
MSLSRSVSRSSFLILCAAFLSIIWFSQANKSPTFDEPYHLAVGYDTFTYGIQRYDFRNPPFARLMAAFPLIFNKDIRHPGTPTNQGDLAHLFAFHNAISPQELFWWPRLVALIPAAWLLWGVFLWGRAMHGPAGGLLSAFFLAVDPNILCNSGIPTLDILTTAAILWASYGFSRFINRPGWKSAIFCGFLLGLALSTRYSALFLVPAFLMAALFFGYKRHGLLVKFLLLLSIAGLTVFAVTGFEVISFRDFSLEQFAIQKHQAEGNWSGLALVPIPFLRYLFGLWMIWGDSLTGRPTFFLGKFLTTGVPSYFPITFLIKTALPVLILLGIGFARLARKLIHQKTSLLNGVVRSWVLLLFPALLYSMAAFTSKINIGYRHLLPVLPFLYVALGGFVYWVTNRWRKIIMAVLLFWLAGISAVLFPDYRAFFNLFAGGPSQGYRYLVDSNLDWGQELIALANFQKGRGAGEIALAYFGTAEPADYGVSYRCIPSTGLLYCPDVPLPEHGWVAVSASCLQGFCTQDNPDFYAPFRTLKPEAVLGYSLFIYHLP